MSGTSKERRKRTTLPPAPPPSVARSYKPKCRGKPFIRGFTVPHRVEVLHNSGLLLSTLTTPPPPSSTDGAGGRKAGLLHRQMGGDYGRHIRTVRNQKGIHYPHPHSARSVEQTNPFSSQSVGYHMTSHTAVDNYTTGKPGCGKSDRSSTCLPCASKRNTSKCKLRGLFLQPP